MAKAPLSALYARFSNRWHSDITRLGYPIAYDELISALPHSPEAPEVLDVGCGTGALAEAWLKKQSRPAKALTLLDNSEPMLAEARLRLAEIPNTHFEAAAIGTETIAAASIDVLLSAHVVEHLEDPVEGLRWFAQSLKPGGHLALSMSKPHWCTALVRWRWGHKAFSPSQAMSMLQDAGFTDVLPLPFSKGPPSRTSHGYIATRA